MTDSGHDKAKEAWQDEHYWSRLAEVFRAENVALRDAGRTVCLLFEEIEKDGSIESIRGILLDARLYPLLYAISHLKRLAVG